MLDGMAAIPNLALAVFPIVAGASSLSKALQTPWAAGATFFPRKNAEVS
jgi:hypothetical protein